MSDEYEMMSECQQVIADWKADYDTLLNKLYQKDEKITELETEIDAEKKRFASVMLRKNTYIAHIERQNELLRVLGSAFDAMIQDEGPSFLIKPLRLRAVEALNDAVDSGALDKDGEK